MEELHADLFELNRRHYLVAVDRTSGFPFIKCWNDSPSTLKVIRALTPWFADFGVPQRIRTDGGPQFRSKEFSEFLERWNIQHRMTSPYHPEANGRSEAAVKAMKALLRHTGDITSEEFHRGLLEWRNTPKEGGRSPAMIIFGCQQRSIVPCPPTSLERTKSPEDVNYEEKERQVKERRRVSFDLRTKELKPFEVGDRVRIQHPSTKRWADKGKVIRVLKRRRYVVLLDDGRVQHRNRKFIRADGTVPIESDK